MDLILAQEVYKTQPFIKDNKFNLLIRDAWGFKKAVVMAPGAINIQFPIVDEPIIGVRLEKNRKADFDFSISDLLADDWRIVNEDKLKVEKIKFEKERSNS